MSHLYLARCASLFYTALILATSTWAQVNRLPAFVMAINHPPLPMPAGPTEVAEFRPRQTALFKPEKSAGNNPAPALVLSPICAGAGPHLRYWVQEGLKAGYVVLVLDHMWPRGAGIICGKASDLSFGQGAKDAQAALDFLAGLGYVDMQKVALMGFSWGGAVALMVGSNTAANHSNFKNSSGLRYAASIAVYPVCHHPSFFRGGGMTSPELDFAFPDIDRPVLALLAELDHEEDPIECSKRLASAAQRGAKVEVVVLPNATHAWDSPEANGRSSHMPWMPKGGTFEYSPAITEVSRERAFTFIQKAFAAR
jgi:dienelactone hydrolase